MGIRKERIKEVFNINIHKLKDDFKKRCTIVGLRGKTMNAILNLSIFLFVLYDIYIIVTVISYTMAEKQEEIPGKFVVFIVVMCTYLLIIWIISIGERKIIIKRNVQSIEGLSDDKIKDIDKIEIILDTNFNKLLKDYKLSNNKELLDSTVHALNKHADETKYYIFAGAFILGSLLLPVWVKLIDKLDKIASIGEFSAVSVVLVIIIYGVYSVLKSVKRTINEDIINRENKIYKELASKLELYKHSIVPLRSPINHRRKYR